MWEKEAILYKGAYIFLVLSRVKIYLNIEMLILNQHTLLKLFVSIRVNTLSQILDPTNKQFFLRINASEFSGYS